MDAAIFVTVFHDRVDECTRSFVQVPRFDDELGEWMLTFLEEALGERRCAFFGLWVADPGLIERFGERLSSPDFDITTGHILNLFEDCLLPLEDLIAGSFEAVNIDPDSAHGHIDETWEEVEFEICDGPEVFLVQLHAEEAPKLKCKLCIDLGIGSYKGGRHLPHLSLRIDAKFCSGSD